ncbi:hypothetical protein BDP27DRAFT_1485852 [Rhodocollybia butyracea]|uniref:Uncharacterized protein n=1 Tax=Rhodocollybia butyracea TaxID=206335 RepID=A0A9P5PDY0_9AGAR|nr:hypothetical protein BDP27DRAFT_1485852 [Rhodocollybia butyracea]
MIRSSESDPTVNDVEKVLEHPLQSKLVVEVGKGISEDRLLGIVEQELCALDHDLHFNPGTNKGGQDVIGSGDKLDLKDHASEMARLKTQRVKLLSLLSPMRKLPNKTLLRILGTYVRNFGQNFLLSLVRQEDKDPQTGTHKRGHRVIRAPTCPTQLDMTNLSVSISPSSEELSALENNLRFEFGPSVVTPEQAKELMAMLALVDKDIEHHNAELTHLETQRTKLLSLLSPMRKLPNETLLHIFQDVCQKNLLQCYPWTMEEEEEEEEEENLTSDLEPPTKMKSPILTYLPSMAISSFVDKSSSRDAHNLIVLA